MKNKLQLLFFNVLLSISAFSQCLSGDCNDGYGKYRYSDGSIYTGDFVSHKAQGKGTYYYISGATYTGEWVNNVFQGKGIYIYPDGAKYDGDWVNNSKHGKGIYIYSDGAKYEGDWVNNYQHGKGTWIDADGDKYDGDWVAGKRAGKGIIIWSNGDKYEGDFVNGSRQGYGVYLSNGDKYEGEWVSDKFTGKGKKTYSSGKVEEGQWTSGVLTSSLITKGENNNEDQYGVRHFDEGTIEGILQNYEGRLDVSNSEGSGPGPYITIKEDYVKIGGFYNKRIEYYNKESAFLRIDIYEDNTQKIKIKEIRYDSNSKITTPYINGETNFNNRVIENFDGNLENIINNELNIVRNSLKGYNPNYLIQLNNEINQKNDNDKKSLIGKIKKWQNKKVLSGNDCDKLFEDVTLAEKNKMLKEAIVLMTITVNKCKPKDKFNDINHSLRATLYHKNAEYKKELSDLLICEGLLKGKSSLFDQNSIYYSLEKCYAALGDYKNSEKYKSKGRKNSEEMAERYETRSSSNNNSNMKKYCVTTTKGRYEISLLDNKTFMAYYKLYDNYNKLIKTIQGKWTIKDEGAYGAAYRLTFDFTGANSNLPSMKFTCQYDGSGQLQAIIDNQDRTWDYCR